MSDREQFEAAWIAANSDSKEKADKVRDALRNIWRDNGSGGGAYFDSFVMMAWTWWKASREALPIAQALPSLDFSQNNDGSTPGVTCWIACADRMPEEGGRYWCYVEEQTSLGKSHYQWNCAWNGKRWWVEHEDGGRVTHWMPLPSPPAINHPIDTTPNQYDALGKGGEQ